MMYIFWINKEITRCLPLTYIFKMVWCTLEVKNKNLKSSFSITYATDHCSAFHSSYLILVPTFQTVSSISTNSTSELIRTWPGPTNLTLRIIWYCIIISLFIFIVSYMSFAYTLPVPSMSLSCPFHIPYMSLSYPLHIPYMYSSCPLHVPHMSLKYPLHVPWMFGTCNLDIPYMSLSRPLHNS